jgi:hypothetical protein
VAKADVRNSRRFKELAGLLSEQAGLRGVTFVAGEAEELLGSRVSAVAAQLGITERTALASYISEETIPVLAEAIGSQAAQYRAATAQAEPVSLGVTQAGRVIAALGMTVKLAAGHAGETQADSLGIITDAADAIVCLGAELGASGPSGHADLGGHELVLARSVLVRSMDLLRAGRWRCSCGPHYASSQCRLVAGLTSDLTLIGGWAPTDSPG